MSGRTRSEPTVSAPETGATSPAGQRGRLRAKLSQRVLQRLRLLPAERAELHRQLPLHGKPVDAEVLLHRSDRAGRAEYPAHPELSGAEGGGHLLQAGR